MYWLPQFFYFFFRWVTLVHVMQCLKLGCAALNADTCCEAILKPYFLTIDPGGVGEEGGQRTRCKKLGKTDLLSRLTVEIRQSMSQHSTMLHMNLIPLTATKWREYGGSSIINSRSTCWLIVCSLLTEWVPALSGQAAGYPQHCIAVKEERISDDEEEV